jgi:hypothetical protein
VSATEYKRAIRSAVYGLWRDEINVVAFIDTMYSAVFRNFTRAWYEGARECGIQAPRELTGTEIQALNAEVANDSGHILNFANAIMLGSKANGGKLGTQYKRAQLWVNRYASVKNHARLLACDNQKMIWELGATEKHCRTCNALHGKVKRIETWRLAGVRPQNPPNPLLECEGWRCGCTLTPTTLPLSRGRLPNLP